MTPHAKRLTVTAALLALTLGLGGCAHRRHAATGAVIGGIIGAGIGYVIAKDGKHKKHRGHEPYYGAKHHSGGGAHVVVKPPPKCGY